METSEKHTFKWLLTASVITLALAILIYFPFLVPAVVVVVWLKFRGTHALLPYFVYLAASYFISLSFSSLMTALNVTSQSVTMMLVLLAVCLTLPATIVSVLAHRSGKRMYESVLWTTLASFFGVAAFVAVVYVFTEKNLTTIFLDAMTRLFNNNQELLDKYYDTTIRINSMLTDSTTTITSTTSDQKMSYLVEMYNEILPAYLGTLMVSFGLLSGFFSYYIPYLFLRNKDVKLTHCPDFKDLRIPKPEWIILLVVFLTASFVSFSNTYNMQVIASVLRPAVSLVFTIQGVAFLTYLYKSKRISFGFFLTLLIIGFMLNFLNILFWLGVLEALMNIRAQGNALENNGGE